MPENDKTYDVKIVVKSRVGVCDVGHQVGETWYMRNGKTPGGVCAGAYSAIHPVATMLMSGGGYHWRENQDIVQVACQDAANPVVFELTRVEPGES